MLFIHGILGTPDHFTDMAALVPPGASVCSLLLDGHGKSVRDFSHSSMRIWKEQVAAAVEELASTHRQLILVAHSMGTLFAIQQAVAHPEWVTDLFLLAVPLRLFIKPRMVTNALKMQLGRIRPDDRRLLAAEKAYGIARDKHFWRYIGWIPRYLELFAEIRRTRELVDAVAVPCHAYQSRRDEMVSIATCHLLGKNPQITVTVLEHSGHYDYGEADYALVLTALGKIIKGRMNL